MKNIASYILLFVYVSLVVMTIGWGLGVHDGSVPVLDQWTNGYAERVEGTHVYWMFRKLTVLGSSSFLIPFVIITSVVIWWWHRDLIPGLVMVAGPLSCYFINTGIKLLVQRERPQILADVDAVGYSFPSGHSMLSVICYGLFLYFLLRHQRTTKTKILLQIVGIILIIMIGASRYVIRVHYLTDVVAGFTIGFLVLVFWVGLYNYIQRIRHKRSLT